MKFLNSKYRQVAIHHHGGALWSVRSPWGARRFFHTLDDAKLYIDRWFYND